MNQADETEKIEDVQTGKKNLLKYFNKKIIIIISIFFVASFIIGFYYIYPNNKSVKVLNNDTKKLEVIKYLTTDNILVNLKSDTDKPVFLKINIQLVFHNETNYEKAQALLPSIKDTYISFLRNLRPSDFETSYSIIELKSILLRNSNKVLFAAVADDIVFDEIILQ